MIVYTAIFNDYDTLRDVFLPEGWKAICFSDRPLKSKTWQIEQIKPFEKVHRCVKICPYNYLPAERTIWIDANLEYLGNWQDLNLPGTWVMQHPERKFVHEEAFACIMLGKDNADTIRKQVDRYERSEVVATGVIIREPEWYKAEFAADWWTEVRDYSHRDQLSFGPMAQKHDLYYKKLPFLKGFIKHKHMVRRIAH